MQHNKNSDANVGIRCEAQATKRKGKRTGKARELDIGKEKRFEKMWNKMQENP